MPVLPPGADRPRTSSVSWSASDMPATSSRITLLASVLLVALTSWTVSLASPIALADTLHQREGFWTAEVAWGAANVHSEPNAQSAIRREVHQGDLLRVAGRTSGSE